MEQTMRPMTREGREPEDIWGNDAFRMLMGLDPLKPFDPTKQYGAFAAVNPNKIDEGMQLFKEQAQRYVPENLLHKVEYIKKHSHDGRVSIAWSYSP